MVYASNAAPDAGTIQPTSRVAVIGGTSLITSSLFANLSAKSIDTEHGSVLVHVSPLGVVYINRHHANVTNSYDMPHEIKYRAIFSALVSLRVRRIYGVCSVGSLNRSLPPGSVVLPSDYNSIFDSTAVHMHDDYRAHVVPSLCEETRSKMSAALAHTGVTVTTETAVYVQVRGPRFETRAEVQFLHRISAGDIIGMTSANEATCARELNIPYAPFCMVDNFANGLAESHLSVESFQANVKKHQPIVEQAVSAFLESEGCKQDSGPNSNKI